MFKKDEYQSPVAHIFWDERGVFILKLKNSSAVYDCEEAKKQYDHLFQCSEGKSYKLVIDTRGSSNFPTDCALKLYSEKNSNETKTAVIADSLPMQLMIGQMIKKLKKERSMTFKTEHAAIEWLLSETK